MHICVAVGPIIIIYKRARARVYCGQRVGVDTVLYYYMPFAAGVHYNISIGIPIYIYICIRLQRATYRGELHRSSFTRDTRYTHTHTHIPKMF
jgi:hypothetical protein